MSISVFLLTCFVSLVFFIMGLVMGSLSSSKERTDEKSLVNLANSVREGKCTTFYIEIDKRDLINPDNLEEMDDFFPELRRWEQN